MHPETKSLPPRLLAGALLPFFILPLFFAFPTAAADWPQWRGLHRDGISKETEISTHWGEDGPPVLWRQPIGGGFASTAVASGRLYTQWSEAGRSYVVCLDAANGREIWRFDAGEAYPNERGGGPRATPTLDGDRLYAVSGGGRIHALALADGRSLWSHDFIEEYGGTLPYYGFSASPLVEGDLVLATGGGEGHALLAFHRDDGRLVWSARDDSTGYSSPIAVDAAGRRQIVFVTGSHIVATTPQGEVLWSYDWPHDYHINVATPLFLPPARFFVSSSYDIGSVVLEVGAQNGEGSPPLESPQGDKVSPPLESPQGDKVSPPLESPQGDKLGASAVWRSRVMKNHFQDSVFHDGYLYGFDNATLKCIRAHDGEEKWRHRGLGKGSLVLAGSQLLVLSERGELVVAPISPRSFDITSAAQVVTERCWTSPALAEGRLYVRTETELLSLDLRPGSVGAGATRTIAEHEATTAPPRDAAGLLARNTKARGGAESWTESGDTVFPPLESPRGDTLRMAGLLNVNGRQHHCVLLRRGTDQLRLDCDFLGMTESYVVAAEKAWWKPLREEEFLAVPPAQEKRVSFALLLSRLELFASELDSQRAGLTAELSGETDLQSGPALKLHATMADGPAETWFFDRASSQVIRKTRRFVTSSEEREYDIYFEDFREAAGRVFPFYSEVDLGTMQYTLQVEKVEIGVELDGEVFGPR